MSQKDNIAKNVQEKAKKQKNGEKSMRKKVTEKGKEIMEWKVKNSTQRWFFSLEEKEQNFLETTYMIVV